MRTTQGLRGRLVVAASMLHGICRIVVVTCAQATGGHPPPEIGDWCGWSLEVMVLHCHGGWAPGCGRAGAWAELSYTTRIGS